MTQHGGEGVGCDQAIFCVECRDLIVGHGDRGGENDDDVPGHGHENSEHHELADLARFDVDLFCSLGENVKADEQEWNSDEHRDKPAEASGI